MTNQITIQFDAINHKEQFVQIYDNVAECTKDTGISYITLRKANYGLLTKYKVDGDCFSFNCVKRGILWKCKILYSNLPYPENCIDKQKRRKSKSHFYKMKDNDTDVLSSNMGQGDIIVVSNLLDKTSGLIVCRGSITKCCSFMFRNLYPIKLLNRKDIAFHKFTKRILDKSRYELERHNKNKITIEDRYVLERLE